MKKTLTIIILFCFIFLYIPPIFSQEEKKKPEEKSLEPPPERPLPAYVPRGRRDPFRDLLGGKEVKETAPVGEMGQLSIDDVVLVGITKARGKFTAIINDPQGFPHFLKVGAKFSDGFVLKIDESTVVFRKTRGRGVPLRKPRDIVKALFPEER